MSFSGKSVPQLLAEIPSMTILDDEIGHSPIIV